MKTKTSLLIGIFLFIGMGAVEAQLKVSSDGNVGIGTSIPSDLLSVQGIHTNTRLRLHSIGGSTDATKADLFLWASEPGLSYTGVGFGNNIYNGVSGMTRYNSARGGSFMRLLDNSVVFNIVSSSGTVLTPLTIQDNGGVSISCQPASSGIIFEKNNFDGNPAIKPQWNNSAWLGLSTHQFWGAYTAHLFINNVWHTSDKRLKTNIKTLTGAMAKINSMNPVSYEWIIDSLHLPKDIKENYNPEKLKKIGFLAQEMNEILPEAVNFDENSKRYGIDYSLIIPVIVQAMKEQNLSIDSLKEQNAFLTEQIGTCCDKKLLKSQTAASAENTYETAILYQNTPNPFSASTEIRYVLPGTSQRAMICIYDMQGKQIRCYNLAGAGEGSITLQGNELVAGMYLYSLIVDSKEIDTKRMILTN